jgi:hypothetical protein
MNSKIKNLLVFLFIAQAAIAFGQKGGNKKEKQEKKAEIEAARIGYITNAIHLTEDQAVKFWPVYNEYSKKRKQLKKQRRKFLKDKDLETISESDAKKLLEEMKTIRKQEQQLNEIYEPQLLVVISYKQLIQLLKAEREFIKMLHKKASGQDHPKHHPREDMD